MLISTFSTNVNFKIKQIFCFFDCKTIKPQFTIIILGIYSEIMKNRYFSLHYKVISIMSKFYD